MSGNLKQLTDGGFGIQGIEQDQGGFIHQTVEWNASSVSKTFFVANRSYVVRGAKARVEVAGTDGSAVTATLVKVPSGTAVASGTTLLTGSTSINLKGTAATKQDLTLTSTAATLRLSPGDALGIVFTGTLTAATGLATLKLSPA